MSLLPVKRTESPIGPSCGSTDDEDLAQDPSADISNAPKSHSERGAQTNARVGAVDNKRRSVSASDIGASANAVSLQALVGNITPMGADEYTAVRCRRNMRQLLKKERTQRFQYRSSAPSRAILQTLSEDTPLMPAGGRVKPPPSEPTKKEEPNDLAVLWDMLTGKVINLLLFVIPFAVASHYLHWSPAAVFWLNFLAMVPLASLLGDFTEEVAEHTNQVIGGLVNATFGNAVEMVVAIQALLANEIRIVQASMIGSIFSNLLLVLGGCFFVGGLFHKEQAFNSTAATANMSLLALSSMALVLPTPFGEYYDVEELEVLAISRFAAIFLIFMYLQLLIFQLKTHIHLFEEEGEAEPEMHFSFAVVGLVVITIIIAILSEFLVSSIDGFCEESGVSRTFVGLIILPVVGNAVEHVTAVSVAAKDKMDLAMGVAVGSSTQISLFVMPLTVIVGWFAGIDMTLNFPHFEVFLYIFSIVIVSICISNPKSNWLEGSLLMTTYLMIATGFWYEKVVDF